MKSGADFGRGICYFVIHHSRLAIHDSRLLPDSQRKGHRPRNDRAAVEREQTLEQFHLYGLERFERWCEANLQGPRSGVVRHLGFKWCRIAEVAHTDMAGDGRFFQTAGELD